MEDRGVRRGWIAAGFALVLLLVVLDQLTKGAVFAWLEPRPAGLSTDVHGHLRYVLAGSWFAFMTQCNPGAAFGQFGEFPEVLVAGRILAVGVLTWFLLRADPRHRTAFVAMVLVLAGAMGNLLDNLWSGCLPLGEGGRPFGVRDFIDVWFEPFLGWDYHFPSFNVADSCITIGAGLFIVSSIFHRRREDEDPAGEAGPDAEATG